MTTKLPEPLPELHTSGEMAGEPILRPAPVVDFGRVRTSKRHGMPLKAAVKAAIMAGEDPREALRVAKFVQGLPGQGHGDSAGDVPPGGTPTSAHDAITGSVLPLISASRQIARTDDQWTTLVSHGQVLPPPYNPWVLVATVEESDVLPMLCTTMATNLTGYGFELIPQYPTRDDEGQPIDPPAEAQQEKEDLELFMLAANIKRGLVGCHQVVDLDTEVTGNGYLEVMRDMEGNIRSFENARAWTMRLGALSQPIAVEQPLRHPTTGKMITIRRYRRFRTYVQVAESRVSYFKEFGDPRFINWRTGQYSDESWGNDQLGNSLDGSEIKHVAIYSVHSEYGVPRWVGAMPSVLNGRCAAELILSWFRGAPIGTKIAMVSGGTMKESSYKQAVGKIDDMARGKGNAWNILFLESESADGADLLDDTKPTPPRMEMQDLAFVLPPELYMGEDNLIDGSARRVARTFRLPPIYWGGSDDFSRAAANTARAAAEENVFVPLRNVRWLQWWNVELLPSMGVNHWKVGLKGANTSDDSEIMKGVAGLAAAGGVSPNMLIRMWNKQSGQDNPPIPEPWADRPFKLTELLVGNGLDPNMPLAQTLSNAPGEEGEVGPDGVPLNAKGQPAQDTALNGAQVTAALAIVQEAVAGGLTQRMAESMLVEFFNLSPEGAASILADSASLEAPQPEIGPQGVQKSALASAEGLAALQALQAKVAQELDNRDPIWFA